LRRGLAWVPDVMSDHINFQRNKRD
jgi:hypothetical protein